MARCDSCRLHVHPSSLRDTMPNSPKMTEVSKQADTPLLSQKKRRDKARWVAAEEAIIIATLLLQKAAGNSSESGFKPSVWTLVVDAVGDATTESVSKNLLQCKTCYHRVCAQFSIYWYVAAECPWPLIISSSRPSTRLCGPYAGCPGLAGIKDRRW